MSTFEQSIRQITPKAPQVLEKLKDASFTPFGETSPKEAAAIPKIASLKPDAQSIDPVLALSPDEGSAKPAVKTQPKRVAVLFSGGQAPGGHNVLVGIYQGLKRLLGEVDLKGIRKGLEGLLAGHFFSISSEDITQIQNTGGFDFLSTSRRKVKTESEFALAKEQLEKNQIDCLVIIGGDDSNTNACLLHQYFRKVKSPIQVLGVPKTIDGDLRGTHLDTSFGFHTATSLYAELVSNIAKDCAGSKKYFHFIRLMGRAASHITLEVALRTRVNYALISEEVAAKGWDLDGVVAELVRVVQKRNELGKGYGVILVPEGLFEFIPEFKELILELNTILEEEKKLISKLNGFTDLSEFMNHRLSKNASYTFSSLPISIQRQILLERDSHGNVQLSQIETEKLLIDLLEKRLRELKIQDQFRGKFKAQAHFFGYEGRSLCPTIFDINYTYSLGLLAAKMCDLGLSGYMAGMKELDRPVEQWKPFAIPLEPWLCYEQRHGKPCAVIQKSLIRMDEPAFQELVQKRQQYLEGDHFAFCGPIQYWGPESLLHDCPLSVQLNNQRTRIEKVPQEKKRLESHISH